MAQGDGKIVVLPFWATIDRASFAIFWLKRMKLRESAGHHLVFWETNLA
jgi:hypothetical protein